MKIEMHLKVVDCLNSNVDSENPQFLMMESMQKETKSERGIKESSTLLQVSRVFVYVSHLGYMDTLRFAEARESI